jgi:hypothetical protein
MSSKKPQKISDWLHSAASGGGTCSQILQSNLCSRGAENRSCLLLSAGIRPGATGWQVRHGKLLDLVIIPKTMFYASKGGGSVDQWISGGRRSHGGAEARRKQRGEPTTRHKGNWRASCSCLCVETPVVAHRCFTLPRSSILCGCINVPGRQANALVKALTPSL